MTVPPRPPWDNPATPEPRRRLPRAAKTASAKKQEADKEEAKNRTKKVATPKKTPGKDVEKPKKTVRKTATPQKLDDEVEKLMKEFKKVSTPKKKPAPIDPDIIPLPPSTGRRAVTREKKSPKPPKTTKNTPKKIGRPGSTKKKTPVRGKKPGDDDVKFSPGKLDDPGPITSYWGPPEGFPIPGNFQPPDAVREKESEDEGAQSRSGGLLGGLGKSRYDDIPPGGRASCMPPPEDPAPRRKIKEKKVIMKKVVRRNKKNGHFEEVPEILKKKAGSSLADDEDFISVNVNVGDVNADLIYEQLKDTIVSRKTKLDKGKGRPGKKTRGRPKKNAVVKDNKLHPWKEGDGSTPAPAPGFGFGNFGAGLESPLEPTGGLRVPINPQEPIQPVLVDPSSLRNFGPFGAGFRPTDNDGCDCAIKNPIYPYGENGEGGPGIGYTCTCPLNGPVQPNRTKRHQRVAPAEVTLVPGESVYISGADLFKGGVKPPGLHTGFEHSSYCEHKLPPKPLIPIWDPTNNMQCGSCPPRRPKTPGNCKCPPEEAFIFTVQAKRQIDGKDNWSPVRNGDVLQMRGHCYKCDKLVRKDDPVKGIGEPFHYNTKTYQRLVDYEDGIEDRAEEEEAAAFNETLGFNPDGTPKVDKDEPVIYKKWNRNGWSDKEVKKAEETRHKQWSTAGGNDEDSLTEIERRHKQWSRANDQNYSKTKKGEQPPSKEDSKTCKCEEKGGFPKDRNGKCACKGKAGGCDCSKRGGVCSCQETGNRSKKADVDKRPPPGDWNLYWGDPKI